MIYVYIFYFPLQFDYGPKRSYKREEKSDVQAEKVLTTLLEYEGSHAIQVKCIGKNLTRPYVSIPLTGRKI